MTKYRKPRIFAAGRLMAIIGLGIAFNVKVKMWLWGAQEFNLLVWRKMSLWTVRLYAWLLRNGNGNGDDNN